MKTINADLLKNMFISGANNVFNHYPEIDALNVFPVPDGDTGTNMNLTLASGVKEIVNRNDTDVFSMSQAFSKGCLFGSRGNSGVITSQIFKGFSLGLEGLKEIGCFDLIKAFQKAKEVPYTAVKNPVEGTILTVLRESTDLLYNQVKKEIALEKCFDMLLEEARASLKRTPDLLPILKEVGVVDSGGAGLVYLFEGMTSAIKGKPIERNQDATSFTNAPIIDKPVIAPGAATMEVDDDEEFGYCTEFILTIGEGENKKPFTENEIKNHLNKEGKSLVFVRDGEILKVHIHTLTPGAILNYVQQYGEFLTLKIENMTKQHSHLKEGANSSNSSQEIKKDEPKKKFGLIAVGAGSGIENIFKELGVDYIVKGGQTMNPSTEDFVNAIKAINAETIFILPNNSNIIMAASQACDQIENVDARVIPSTTILQGMTSMMNFSSEFDADQNFEEMRSALKTVVSGSVTKAIKDTEINGVKVVKDNYIGLMNKNILSCVNDKTEALLDLIEGMINEDSAVLTVIYGEDVTEEEAKSIEEKISEKYPDLDINIREGGQPHYSFFVGVE